MKYLLTCIVVIFILSGCSIGGSSESDYNEIRLGDEAIAKVILETSRFEFPTKEGKTEGIILGGGPVPGLRIPGEFTSAAMREDKDTFVITLTEYWSSDDFQDENSPEETILSHYWKYRVTDSEVELHEEGGDFSPEHVE
ncbi:hypothetical protein [Paenibacillus antarcticus]|uniref:Uncharacterized protein n=1 Tax=Paenibacillus antarcticus TaxID=253703 RepID=A0A168MG00_9BACL|nr:hypothetical protein [Paenibacillus antarcticus]OAB44629.1 hypothetical protein PBAT_15310 [Paenibacillus antarcticus]